MSKYEKRMLQNSLAIVLVVIVSAICIESFQAVASIGVVGLLAIRECLETLGGLNEQENNK